MNAKGGLLVDGVRHPVKLLVRDDKTDPSVSVGLVETLITRDHVVAMLGSASPALVNPDSIAGERQKPPTVSTACPIEAFKSAHEWKYSWCLFFDEPDLASASLRAIKDFDVPTNKKIAILHDNGPDGMIVGGQMWPKIAKDLGFEIVASLAFPIDNNQFTSIIEQIRACSPTSCSATRRRRRRSSFASSSHLLASRPRFSSSKRARSRCSSASRSASSPMA